jgi:hypothetical protein
MDYPPPQPTQVTEQPDVVDTPLVDYEKAAGSVSVDEPVGQQSGAGFPWVVVAVVAGIAVIGGAVGFVVLRKKK